MAINVFPPAVSGGAGALGRYWVKGLVGNRTFKFAEPLPAGMYIAEVWDLTGAASPTGQVGFLTESGGGNGTDVLKDYDLVSNSTNNSSFAIILATEPVHYATLNITNVQEVARLTEIVASFSASSAVVTSQTGGTAYAVTTSQTVTLASSAIVMCLGGGAGSARTHTSGNAWSAGGGGGSGYISTAIVPAGSYSAAIGGGGGSSAAGGSTTFGGTLVVAAGGLANPIGSQSGGDGGSGGGNSIYGTGRTGGNGGFNGSNGSPHTISPLQAVGQGSGVQKPAFAPQSIAALGGINTIGQAGGFYGGGGGGTGTNTGASSAAANTGGGGGGAIASGAGPTGSNGGSGVIWILEGV